MAEPSTEAPVAGDQDAAASDGQPQFVFPNVFGAIAKRTDIAMALGVVAILVVLILPMPRWLLDFALAASITFSVLILMTALFIERPLDFSSFPTVLLIATVSRLALNLEFVLFVALR